MKQNKILCLLLALVLALSLLAGCAGKTTSDQSAASEPTEVSAPAAETEEPAEQAEPAAPEASEEADPETEVDENEAAAGQLLVDLTGSYQELWPVILDEQYTRTGWTTALPSWARITRRLPMTSSPLWSPAPSTAKKRLRLTPMAAALTTARSPRD